jgi:hypothetical protein
MQLYDHTHIPRNARLVWMSSWPREAREKVIAYFVVFWAGAAVTLVGIVPTPS